MSYQSTFKRYELKFILTQEQKAAIEQAMYPHMQPDRYGLSTIRNIYYDTEDYRLIRSSIEKPVYKEKLRLRSYRKLESTEPAFVELKRKYDGVVYKRRLSLCHKDAVNWLAGNNTFAPNCQIAREIQYFSSFYETLHPVLFLAYDRVAWFSHESPDLRVTFDDHITCRQDRLSLCEDPGGASILPEGITLMEIKTAGGIPLWLTEELSKNRIFKTSFSKYGTAYKTLIYKGAQQYV